MKITTIKVHYYANETGLALLVARRVAVILDMPILGDLCRGSVVRLDRDPER